MSDAKRAAIVEAELPLPHNFIEGESPLKKSLAERMQDYGVPGVSIAVINEGAIEWAKGYGLTSLAEPSPVSTETRFAAASVSKLVAALASLILVQSGLLNLDEDVNRKLTSWQVPPGEHTGQQPVTLRHLLSHTAGLAADHYGDYSADEAMPTLLQLLTGRPPAKSAPVTVRAVPGTRYQYAGQGYWVLQQLLEDVTGQPFANLMQEIVFEPLGMSNSTFCNPLPEPYIADAAVGHQAGQPASDAWSRWPAQAEGGLWTTPSDLAKFAIALRHALAGRSKPLLSQSPAMDMLTPQGGNHGLGPEIWGSGQATLFRHGGEGDGFECVLMAFHHTGQGAAVMNNGADSYNLNREILRSIAEVYDWPYYRPPRKRIAAVNPERLLAYAGDYRLTAEPLTLDRHREYAGPWRNDDGEDIVYRVRAIGEILQIQLPTDYRLTFYPETADTFFTPDDELVIRFLPDQGGPVNEVEVVFWSGLTVRGARLDDY